MAGRPPSIFDEAHDAPADLVTLDVAATFLGIDEAKLSDLVDSRRVLHYMVAGRPMFVLAELSDWAERQPAEPQRRARVEPQRQRRIEPPGPRFRIPPSVFSVDAGH